LSGAKLKVFLIFYRKAETEVGHFLHKNRLRMSIAIVAEPIVAEPEDTSNLPNEAPLNIEVTQKVRTKLHLYTTLIALYVSTVISDVE
jgi:hypothetical protein